MRYDFNGYAVPYARSRTGTTEAPGHLLRPPLAYLDVAGSGAPIPSSRSGEPRSTAIGGAARATRGCLAPRTHKYPDAVLPGFRTTPWLVLARFYALDSYTYHYCRSRIPRSTQLRSNKRIDRSSGIGAAEEKERLSRSVIKCGFQ